MANSGAEANGEWPVANGEVTLLPLYGQGGRSVLVFGAAQSPAPLSLQPRLGVEVSPAMISAGLDAFRRFMTRACTAPADGSREMQAQSEPPPIAAAEPPCDPRGLALARALRFGDQAAGPTLGAAPWTAKR